MKNRSLIILSLLLLLSIGNYTRVSTGSPTRTVEIISLLVTGVLLGAIISRIWSSLRK